MPPVITGLSTNAIRAGVPFKIFGSGFGAYDGRWQWANPEKTQAIGPSAVGLAPKNIPSAYGFYLRDMPPKGCNVIAWSDTEITAFFDTLLATYPGGAIWQAWYAANYQYNSAALNFELVVAPAAQGVQNTGYIVYPVPNNYMYATYSTRFDNYLTDSQQVGLAHNSSDPLALLRGGGDLTVSLSNVPPDKNFVLTGFGTNALPELSGETTEMPSKVSLQVPVNIAFSDSLTVRKGTTTIPAVFDTVKCTLRLADAGSAGLYAVKNVECLHGYPFANPNDPNYTTDYMAATYPVLLSGSTDIAPIVETYTPHIDSISPDIAVAGTTITLIGENFSTSGTVKIGTQVVPTLTYSDTTITFAMPEPYIFGNVTVTTTEGVSNAVKLTQKFVWTDDPLIKDVTPPKATHIAEMRTHVTGKYQAAGLTAPAFRNNTPMPGDAVSLKDVEDLRAAIISKITPTTFTDPDFSVFPRRQGTFKGQAITLVLCPPKTEHISELRAYIDILNLSPAI